MLKVVIGLVLGLAVSAVAQQAPQVPGRVDCVYSDAPIKDVQIRCDVSAAGTSGSFPATVSSPVNYMLALAHGKNGSQTVAIAVTERGEVYCAR